VAREGEGVQLLRSGPAWEEHKKAQQASQSHSEALQRWKGRRKAIGVRVRKDLFNLKKIQRESD